jgi:hypothetical protein
MGFPAIHTKEAAMKKKAGDPVSKPLPKPFSRNYPIASRCTPAERLSIRVVKQR